MKKKLLVLTIVLLCFYNHTHACNLFEAQHIRYRYIGGDQYIITANCYTPCFLGWPSVALAPPTVLILLYSPDNLSSIKTLSLPKMSISLLPGPTCPGVNCNNSSLPFTNYLITYQDTVDLGVLFGSNFLANNCRFRVGLGTAGCRGISSNVVVQNSIPDLYTESELNICLAKNNTSPVFVYNPGIQIPPLFTPLIVSNYAVDSTDFDSTSYEFIQPQTDRTTNVTYNGSFNVGKPFLYVGYPALNLPINSMTGDINYQVNSVQTFYLAVKVWEWRKINGNWLQIGFVVKEWMNMTSNFSNTNTSPLLQFLVGNNTQYFCKNMNRCFQVKATDPDTLTKGDSTVIRLTYTNAPGLTFTTLNTPVNIKRTDVANICWTGDTTTNRAPAIVILTVSDNACPNHAEKNYTIFLSTIKSPVCSIQKTNLYCNRYQFNAVYIDSVVSAVPEWKVCRLNTGIYYDSLTDKFPSKSINYFFKNAGKYVVRLRYYVPGACEDVRYDTITVNPLLSVSIAGDSTYCLNTQAVFSETHRDAIGNVQYLWTRLPGGSNIFSIWPFKIDTSFSLALKVTDSVGCVAVDTLNVRALMLPVISADTARICSGDSILFDAGNNNGKGVQRYEWTGPGNIASPNATLFAKQPGSYTIQLTDSANCRSSAIFLLSSPPEVQVNSHADTAICMSDAFQVIASGAQKYIWYNLTQSGQFPDMDTNAILQMKPTQSLSLLLKGSITDSTSLTCFGSDTLRIQVNQLPQVRILLPDTMFCCNTNPFHVKLQPAGYGNLFLNGSPFNTTTITPCQPDTQASNKLVYYFTDSITGCSSSDSIRFRTEIPSIVRVSNSTDSLCKGASLSFYASQTGTHSTLQWNYPGLMKLFEENDSLGINVPLTFTGNIAYVTAKSEAGFRCPSYTDSVSFFVSDKPTATASISPDSACGRLDALFNCNTDAANTILWNFGDSNSSTAALATHSYAKTGNYIIDLTVSTHLGCISVFSGLKTLYVHNQPAADFSFTPALATVDKPVYYFKNLSQFNVSDNPVFLWQFNDPGQKTSTGFNPMFTYPFEEAVYHPKLFIQTIHGCIDSATADVSIVPALSIFYPTAFHPESDIKENQVFRVVANYFVSYELYVYNRWGQLIFESDDITNEWDGSSEGKNCPQDVYAFIIRMKGLNNEFYNYSGTVQLIR